MTITTTSGEQVDFSYQGNMATGVTLIFDTGNVELPAELFTAVLQEFNGRSVLGGFNMTEPPEEGIGYFVKTYAEESLNKSISARYASHLCAILRDEGLVELSKEGRAIVVTFL